MQIIDEINNLTLAKNWEIKILPIEYINNLKNSIEETFKKIKDKNFVDFISNCFNFKIEDIIKSIRSIIIIAIPSPKTVINIKWDNIEKKIIIPPTYSKMNSVIDEAESLLSNILNKENYFIKRVKIPEKLIAVHSGLGQYGKNNICYIKGMGSFFRLVSFISNIEAIDFTWEGINIMEPCNKCNICLERCPTGAIKEDSILIDAHKCLTYFNESPGIFPVWIDDTAHNSLVGCLLCQDKCPQNKKFINNFCEYDSLNENELPEILNIKKFEKLDLALQSKLKNLGMDTYYYVLSRNLKVLL